MPYWSFSVPLVAGIAVMSLIRSSTGLTSAPASLQSQSLAPIAGIAPVGSSTAADSHPSETRTAVDRLLSLRTAPESARFASAAEDVGDVCKTPFKPLLAIKYPPLLVGGPNMPLERSIQGLQFPRWQPIETPFIPNRLAWAQVDEFRITVHRNAVLHEGWTSPADFVATWLADMGAVPERPTNLRSGQKVMEATAGSTAFNARLVFEHTVSAERRVPGGVIRADLRNPDSRGHMVRTMDSEIVETGHGFVRLASISDMGDDDNVPRRNPLSGVRELGYFEGEGAAWEGHKGGGNKVAEATAGSSAATAASTKPAKDGLVTFYTRAVYSVDGGDDDVKSVSRTREAWSGFIRGIGERFGLTDTQAKKALRGLGGYHRVFGYIRERPSCFMEQDSDVAQTTDMSGGVMQG